MLKSVVLHDIPMDHVAAMERWYWRDHSPEVVRRFGPWEARHDSWLPVDAPPEAHPPMDSVMPAWDRVIELWYDNFADWRRSVTEAPPSYTKPDWASAPAYPFLEPNRDFVSSFILERPTDEFLRDARGYL